MEKPAEGLCSTSFFIAVPSGLLPYRIFPRITCPSQRVGTSCFGAGSRSLSPEHLSSGAFWWLWTHDTHGWQSQMSAMWFAVPFGSDPRKHKRKDFSFFRVQPIYFHYVIRSSRLQFLFFQQGSTTRLVSRYFWRLHLAFFFRNRRILFLFFMY